jgi:hypothetical protein
VAAAAADLLAVPGGVDISSAMVAEASDCIPISNSTNGPRRNSPFEDREFGALVRAFGMPHFADRAAF